MFGSTVIGIRWKDTIGGTKDTGLVRHMAARVGSRRATMGSVFLKAIGTAIAAGVSTSIVGIAIVTVISIEIVIGTGIGTAIGTTTVASV
jgi:putative effector of murein hydrolase